LPVNAVEAIASMDHKRPTPIVRDAQVLLARGIDALERGHLEEAAGLLRQTVELDPQSFHGFLGLGIALTRLYEIPQAQKALETALALEPNNFYAHLRMAELHLRVGVPTRAREELQQAMDLSDTPEQRKIVRELQAIDAKRATRRAWRPDFSFLRKRKERPR
jgi:Tfp pilus assembly protein PilF